MISVVLAIQVAVPTNAVVMIRRRLIAVNHTNNDNNVNRTEQKNNISGSRFCELSAEDDDAPFCAGGGTGLGSGRPLYQY